MEQSRLLFITLEDVLRLQEQQIVLHGGAHGVGDPALLESALAAPKNLRAYGEPTIFELAACDAYHLSKNHPFIDGNKRAALMSCIVFLDVNGFDLASPPDKLYEMMLGLASGEVAEASFTTFLEQWCRRRKEERTLKD